MAQTCWMESWKYSGTICAYILLLKERQLGETECFYARASNYGAPEGPADTSTWPCQSSARQDSQNCWLCYEPCHRPTQAHSEVEMTLPIRGQRNERTANYR